jgi:hypothetical protein
LSAARPLLLPDSNRIRADQVLMDEGAGVRGASDPARLVGGQFGAGLRPGLGGRLYAPARPRLHFLLSTCEHATTRRPGRVCTAFSLATCRPNGRDGSREHDIGPTFRLMPAPKKVSRMTLAVLAPRLAPHRVRIRA